MSGICYLCCVFLGIFLGLRCKDTQFLHIKQGKCAISSYCMMLNFLT
nr:MAG TPA: hypothetical protein [Caudoviricetes sp.]